MAIPPAPSPKEVTAIAQGSLEQRATNGDRAALEALLREHAGAIFGLCHHLSGPMDGTDAAQEAMERAVTSIDRFDPDRGEFKPWVLTVARNVCRDRMRRRKLERAAFVSDGEEKSRGVMGSFADPERSAVAKDEAQRLGEALETLPEGMREAVVLFHVNEASYEEIAEMLSVPIGTVMTWLHRGRKRLREVMEATA